MWPSENAVKKTLSGTSELVFDTAGYLKLNEKFTLAANLDSVLITAAISSINIVFEQEEKLTLAYQLRDYIDSCRHQKQVNSEKLSLWKNFTRLLSSPRHAFVFFSVLFVVLPCLITWPVIVSSLLISPFLFISCYKWFKQRLNYRLAETAQIQHTRTLKALIDASNQLEHPINPLVITAEKKLFKACAPQEIPNFPRLTKNDPDLTKDELQAKLKDFSEKLALLCGNQNLTTEFLKHIGTDSTYKQKELLKYELELVYYRLKGDLDLTLDPLPEKVMLVKTLIEDIKHCTPGFHNRVNTILWSFQKPKNFSELLYWVRKQLVENATLSLRDDDVHTANRFTIIANKDGLGIQPNFAGDIHRGNLNNRVIRRALQSEFTTRYTFLSLPKLLVDTLRGVLIEVGYSGAKEIGESYTTGDGGEVDTFTALIKTYLTRVDLQRLDWKHFFSVNGETYHIRDIKWELIQQYFFEQLLDENYFTIPSFEDFSKNLSPLLTYKNKQDWNYLMLLAHSQPASLKLLFYYLQRHPGEVTEKIKTQLIPLFFAKNKMSQNAVQLAAQHHPDSLILLLEFIEEHFEQFDLDFNDFILAAQYHPEALSKILALTDRHLSPSNKQTIPAFFLTKNAIGWNIFINTVQKQPKIALDILNYIMQHEEIFDAKTSKGKSLFKENLAKIRQGLWSLMSIKNPDTECTNTLLKFISVYPEVITHTSKKVAPFILSSLAVIDDKKIIDAVFASYAALLLNYFSEGYFTIHKKNLPYVIEKLLFAYSAELTTRKNNNVTYITTFFKQHVGYSTDEKWQALHALMAVMENSPDCEKAENLKTLKSNSPALNNGRLSQLFKACCYNDAVMQQIKIGFQR